MNTSRMNAMSAYTIRSVFVFIAMCIVFLIAYPAHAQLGLPGVERALSITFAPLHPGPGDTIVLTAQSALLDLSGGEILWRANGKTIAQGDADSVTVVAGALGTVIEIEAFAVAADGTSASATATIIPTELDVLIDSNAYLPPFFHGRGRASVGTNLHLQAIPHFKRPGGQSVGNSDIIYTWRKNGEVIGDISGRGKSAVRIPMQHLYGVDRISVEARTPDNLLSDEFTFTIAPVQPFLELYQNHPLYGILYHRALGPASSVDGPEMTFTAVPYFAEGAGGNDPALTFDWSVNGKALPPSAAKPDSITINADNSSGIAVIGLELTHATNFYIDARGLWNVTFSTSAASAPFGAFGQ